MADDLSLLFRLRGDSTGLKAASVEGRAAISQLKQAFGPELASTVSLSNKTFSDLAGTLSQFAGQRIPLVGGAFVRLTDSLRGAGAASLLSEKAFTSVGRSIESIAVSSGKTIPQITSFLGSFIKLETQAAKNDAAFKFFGGSVDLIGNRTAKLLPELNATASAMSEVSAVAASTGASVAALAGPIAIAIAALAAEIVVVVSLSKEIFRLAKASADYQGKLHDLSQQVGVSVETLSALEVAARTTGGSVDSLVQSLGIFQRHLEEAVEDSGGKAAIAFRKLSVDATDTETALRQTIAALARMPEGFQQTALALEVFGRGGKAFLAIAKETNGDIDEITKRLGGLGLVTTEQAKLADQFNDQLVELDVQLRGIGTEAIPVVLDALKGLSRELKDNRELFVLLQNIIKAVAITITVPLKVALGILKTEFEKARFVLEPAVLLLERMKDAIEFISGHPIQSPFGSTDTSTPPEEKKTVDPTDPFLKQVKEEIEARKRLQGVLNFEFAQRQQQAQSTIALAQRELEAGKRTRQELLDATIAGTRKQTQAQTDALQVERDIKLRELVLAKDDVKRRTEIQNAMLAIDTQIAGKRAEQRRNEADLRAKAQSDEQKSQLAHEQAKLDTLTLLGNQRIAAIEDLLRREKVDRETGLAEIEAIENAALSAKGQLLKRELELAGVGPDRQAVLDKIKAVEVDRTALERQQSERRKQIAREEFQTKREILLSEINTQLEIEQIRAERLIDANEALAKARIQSEEEAARKILAIRLQLIDSEIEATKTRLKAAGSITDADERLRTEAELNSRLKILGEQRKSTQAQGERDTEEGRRRDVDNARRYADDLEEIQERIVDIERDAAEEVLRLMVIHFASRRDIVRARLRLDIEDENARHRNAQQGIAVLRQENLESNRTQAEKLAQEQEINRLAEAEAERHRLALKGIKDQGRKDEEAASPLGQFQLGKDQLKEFASELESAIVPLNQILANSFGQVADAIGSVVANWVLLGTTGPAVMRKILAQALASLAAEAAVNAIKELALGFATLFFNPAESAAHFTSAAIWGSIAGGAAVVGRSVAGDLFKPSTSSGSTGSGRGETGELNPLSLARNAGPGAQQQFAPQIQPPQVMRVEVNDSLFAKAIKITIVDDVNNAGPIREVLAGDGNLDRG